MVRSIRNATWLTTLNKKTHFKLKTPKQPWNARRNILDVIVARL